MKKVRSRLLFILFMFGTAFAALRQTNFSTYDMLMNRFLFTSGGTASGASIMDINTGGMIIVYWPLKDGSGNNFLTGWSLSGSYVTIADSWTYYILNPLWYLTWSALSWYLTWISETDPIWNANSGNYVEWNSVSTWILWGASDTLLMSQNAISGFVRGFGYIDSGYLTPYLLIANSGDYYNSNPLWFITWSSLWAYCLLSGNQNITGTINIVDLYDGNGNRYITGNTSDIVKTLWTQWTGNTTGLTVTNANINSWSVVMWWTITSGTQNWFWEFVMTGGAMLVESSTWENVVFSFIIYK